MTAVRLDQPASALVLPGLQRRGTGILAIFAAQVERWMRNRRAERQMAAMSDDQLRDIGINRADIARVVWQGRA